tara:strand:+ start:940 stop:1167 length:228 start_codon:yes stop_codon:yes gene_type:complete
MAITNDEALALLAAKRGDVNGSINGLNAYRTNKEEWKAAIVTAKMAEVRTLATSVGVDLTDWDGSDPAPVPVEVE